jgi:hypothetical protein
MVDDREWKGESLGRAFRGATRVRVDRLECEISEEAEVEARVFDGRRNDGKKLSGQISSGRFWRD